MAESGALQVIERPLQPGIGQSPSPDENPHVNIPSEERTRVKPPVAATDAVYAPRERIT